MSTKYANLPDIDSAQDVYETPDTFSGPHHDSEDEDITQLPRGRRGAQDAVASKDELDGSSLMSTEEASQKFKRAEKRRDRRTTYTYPPSPSSPTLPEIAPPLSHRLRMLQHELSSLEAELADPTSPLLRENDGNENAGELIKGLVDVRSRLEEVSKSKEGRGRLVGRILSPPSGDSKPKERERDRNKDIKDDKDNKGIAEMDRRVGELERLVGSSSAALDESSPLPPPLLPLLTRLNTQLTVLTQPRHIDSISRRLKLLLSDLDRLSNGNSGHRRSSSQSGSSPQPPTSQIQADLTPILQRLAPHLPTIPHILARLRTLSALHSSAAEFQGTLEQLEAEQKKSRAGLEELRIAVDGLEASMEMNSKVSGNNVKGLEDRVEALSRRLDALQQ